MRPATSFATLAVLAAGLAACHAEAEKTPPSPTPPAAVPAANAAPAAAAAQPAHEMKKITASASYPLKTCVVSGEELPAVEKRVAYSYDGTEVQFCCPDCVKDFEKEPAKYIAMIQAAPK